jgi:hypothetical protein
LILIVCRATALVTEAHMAEAEPAANEFYDLVEIHERTFQNYSIRNNIYRVPVDEVRNLFCWVLWFNEYPKVWKLCCKSGW